MRTLAELRLMSNKSPKVAILRYYPNSGAPFCIEIDEQGEKVVIPGEDALIGKFAEYAKEEIDQFGELETIVTQEGTVKTWDAYDDLLQITLYSTDPRLTNLLN